MTVRAAAIRNTTAGKSIAHKMTVRALVAGAVVVATEILPASACKGPSTLFRDDFTQRDPSWAPVSGGSNVGSYNVGGGTMTVKSKEDHYAYIEYDGALFPEADFCADVILPPQDASESHNFNVYQAYGIFAGLAFLAGDGTKYMATVNFGDQVGYQAAVWRWSRSGLTILVRPGTLDALNSGADAVNRLRLTWKGPPLFASGGDSTVSFYINDKLYSTIDVAPDRERRIGLVASTAGSIAQFRNLLVTRD